MLVLSRKTDEVIVIGSGPGTIEIKVVEIRSSRLVRLGIQAPADVPVHRKEVYDAIQRENNRTHPS